LAFEFLSEYADHCGARAGTNAPKYIPVSKLEGAAPSTIGDIGYVEGPQGHPFLLRRAMQTQCSLCKSFQVLVLYLDRTFEIVGNGTVLLGCGSDTAT
jgi:hypothetical protein